MRPDTRNLTPNIWSLWHTRNANQLVRVMFTEFNSFNQSTPLVSFHQLLIILGVSDIGQIFVGFNQFPISIPFVNCLLKPGDGIRHIVLQSIQDGNIVVGTGMVGIKFDQFFKGCQRLIVLAVGTRKRKQG